MSTYMVYFAALNDIYKDMGRRAKLNHIMLDFVPTTFPKAIAPFRFTCFHIFAFYLFRL